MTVIPTLPGSTTATVNDSGKPTKDDYNWRTQLNGLLRKNSFLANPGTANQILASDGSNPGYEDLTTLLDALFGTAEGTIIARGASAWGKLDPADGYLKNASGVLSWGAISAPPQWELISTTTVSGNVTLTGLDDYQEIELIMSGITTSTTATLNIQVSADGGTTWKTTSGDYYYTAFLSGAQTASTFLFVNNTATASAYAGLHIKNWNLSAPKSVQATFGTSSLSQQAFIAAAAPLNAIRLHSSAGTPNGGTIYALGLPTA
jgi:hypothetical protein